MIVALTGCIGSGKSFYLNKIKEIYNYPIFDADKIAMTSQQNKLAIALTVLFFFSVITYLLKGV